MLIGRYWGLDWHLELQVLAVIRIRGVTAIGNIISIGLNGLMFGTIESCHIIDTLSGVVHIVGGANGKTDSDTFVSPNSYHCTFVLIFNVYLVCSYIPGNWK